MENIIQKSLCISILVKQCPGRKFEAMMDEPLSPLCVFKLKMLIGESTPSARAHTYSGIDSRYLGSSPDILSKFQDNTHDTNAV